MTRWKSLAVLVLSLICVGGVVRAAPSQVTRNPGESDTDFVQRVTKQTVVPGDAGPAQIARTSALVPGAETLIAFTEAPDRTDPDPDPDPAYDIVLNVFVKKSDRSDAWIGKTTACEIEGGSATLRSFFYVRPDGAAPEVAVICGWDETHRGADCDANDEVRFFKIGPDAVTDVPMKKYETLFYKQVKPDSRSSFTCTVSKFRNAADVKRLLKQG